MERVTVQQPAYLWSMTCDHFLIDQTGKYSFIGVFDRIGAVSFPAVQKTLWVVVALEGPPDTSATALLDIWSPDGELIVSTAESRLQFSSAGRTLFVNLLYDLQLSKPGAYNVTVEVGGKPIASFSFEVYSVSPHTQ